ncbi:hypothetical protein [Lysinibacillus sp. NPDC086135]|uniref:hypothetical protein n=1 Tax=Lysinibacillus sp. NPDC086135 TaxID=3364130 RepID=UPI003816E42B
MKINIICEKCETEVELTPKTVGRHANLNDLDDRFRISEIKLDENFDEDEPPKEFSDLDIRVEEVRIDCKNCGEYIVLNNFPTYVYR